MDMEVGSIALSTYTPSALVSYYTRHRMTLLQVVQRVLDAMNHDSVNSIDATIESRQIAEEARVVFYDLMDRDTWKHLIKLMPLQTVADTTRPNYLRIPVDVANITDIRYETTDSDDTFRTFTPIEFLEPEDFLDYTYTRRTDEDNVITVYNYENVPMFILNDQAPTYWTTFDDEYIVFDSYDAEVDIYHMLGEKSLMRAKVIPVWVRDNSFTPDLPDQLFSTYIAEVTASCFTYWKQGTSIKDEQRAARGISRLRRSARKTNEHIDKARYGRHRPRTLSNSLDGTKGSIIAAL